MKPEDDDDEEKEEEEEEERQTLCPHLHLVVVVCTLMSNTAKTNQSIWISRMN